MNEPDFSGYAGQDSALLPRAREGRVSRRPRRVHVCDSRVALAPSARDSARDSKPCHELVHVFSLPSHAADPLPCWVFDPVPTFDQGVGRPGS